jgi:hypothetical protein
MKTLLICLLCLFVGACAAGPSPEKVAAMKAECASQKTPVAYAKCANEVEQREAPDPYPELANIVYAARLDLARGQKELV